MRYLLSIIWLLMVTQAMGMLTDGVHNMEDYQKLANDLSQQDPSFNAACLLYDKTNKIAQTAVLIPGNILITAAHGVVETLKGNGIPSLSASNCTMPVKNVVAIFNINGENFEYDVESMTIDVRYLLNDLGQEPKFDLAFVKLVSAPPYKLVKPVQIFHEEIVENEVPLIVMTYGNSDNSKNFVNRRAFYLFENDLYYLPGYDSLRESNRSLLLSSLFFQPNQNLPLPDEFTQDELTIRTWYATKGWSQSGKKPYALALPGTSGAPVFVKIRDQYYLFAIITSFAPFEGNFQTHKGKEEVSVLLKNPTAAQGKYITIFALLYKQSNDPYHVSPTSRHYFLDPNISKILNKLRE